MLRTRSARDEGFTVIEVMVALVIFALFATASAGLLVNSLRSAAAAKRNATAHQLAQADIERVKALVFQSSDPTALTLLMQYYPNATATTTSRGTNGFVPASDATNRWAADGDPSTGAFYRTEITDRPTDATYRRFLVLQFISASGVVAPVTSSYSPTSLPLPGPSVHATLAVTWNTIGPRNYIVQTEITTSRASVEQFSGQASMIAVRVSGIDRSPSATQPKLVVEGPSITLRGELTDNAVAAVTARGATASDSIGPRIDGAVTTANAPPDEVATNGSGTAGVLRDGSTVYGTVGATGTSSVSAKASYGTPLVATQGAPATATLASTSSTSPPFTMTTVPNNALATAKLQLDPTTTDIARATVPACGTCAAFTAQGYMSTADNGVSHSVDASVSAAGASGVGLFPTSFAPQGVVIVQLTTASLTCHVGGTYPSPSAPTVAAAYTGTVKYWTGNGTTGSYQTVAVNGTQSTSPLDAILTANPQVWSYTSSSGTQQVNLRDYISTWTSAPSGVLAGLKQATSDLRQVSANLDGFISVTTVGALESSQGDSQVSLQMGSASCAAADTR